MKRLFLIIALAFTVQAHAQDEIPTPEAFAKDCRNDMVVLMQQITERLTQAELTSDGVEPRLGEDIDSAIARLKLKREVCIELAKMLGEDYVTRLEKIADSPEYKLAAYRVLKTLEKLGLQAVTNLAEENQRSSNTQREVYILAIRQKVERNWIRPVESNELAACEVQVIQAPGGIILDVAFGACDGSSATYRASIENAVYKAEPLPKPGDPELFEPQLIFFFNPSVQ